MRLGFVYSKYFLSSKPEIVSNDAIVLSDSCVKQLKELCDTNVFLRLCVESGGCSGFQYKFDLDDKLADDDKLVNYIKYPYYYYVIISYAICLICNSA